MRDACAISIMITAIALASFATTSACAQDAKQTVLAHYVAWYASKPVSGEWGWHWTMNRFNPDTVSRDGRREIASHDSPLIGPYDSGDDITLECQVLLMKFAGLDGVVIDWYGTADFRDYALIHRNTQRLITHLKRAGLQYAICYEDQSITHMVANGHLPQADDCAEGSRAVKWLAENCFGDPSYVKWDGRPVLLVFGPQHLTKAQLQAITAGCPIPPVLFGLPHLWQNAGMDGAFGWPPVSGGREISRDAWLTYLAQLHSRDRSVSVSFPAYRDIYKEAGLHDSYGVIDGRDGKTFVETLDLALSSKSRILQIATWNDYGEGTVIEPTIENGYQYLEVLQKCLASQGRFTEEDLRLPIALYTLHKRHPRTSAIVAQLKEASDLLFAGKCKEARKVLDASQ